MNAIGETPCGEKGTRPADSGDEVTVEAVWQVPQYDLIEFAPREKRASVTDAAVSGSKAKATLQGLDTGRWLSYVHDRDGDFTGNLTTTEQVNNGDGTRKIWIQPIDFAEEDEDEDEQRDKCSGLDMLSPDGPWLMVPFGGPNAVKNRVAVLSSASMDIPISIKSNNPAGQSNPVPGLLTESEEEVEIAGGVDGDGESIVFGIEGVMKTHPSLRIRAAAEKSVSVAIHPITFDNSDASTLHAPQGLGTKQEIEDHLNNIYGKQANVYFEVTISAGATVNWDEAGNLQAPDGSQILLENNDEFDIRQHIGALTVEQEQVMAAVSDVAADFNIYYIGAPDQALSMGMKTHLFIGNANVSGNAVGVASSTNGVVFIIDFDRTRSSFGLNHAIAHEIGHLFGLFHSDQKMGNSCFLSGVDPEFQLMINGERFEAAKDPCLLIKCEWDVIRQWIDDNP